MLKILRLRSFPFGALCQFSGATVDGKHPAPPGMYKTFPKKIGEKKTTNLNWCSARFPVAIFTVSLEVSSPKSISFQQQKMIWMGKPPQTKSGRAIIQVSLADCVRNLGAVEALVPWLLEEGGWREKNIMVKCRDLYCTSFMGAMGLLNIKVTYKDTCCCVNESMWIYCKTKYAYCIYIYIYLVVLYFHFWTLRSILSTRPSEIIKIFSYIT